jgi:tetratricopeptide (TPR) repeat protein
MRKWIAVAVVVLCVTTVMAQTDNQFAPDAERERVDAYVQSDPQRAIQDYTELLRKYPKDLHVYQRRGIAYLIVRNLKAAVQDDTMAITLTADLLQQWSKSGARVVAQKMMGDAYRLRMTKYYAWEKYDNVIADATEALRYTPDEVGAYEYRGEAYYFKKDYDQAIVDFKVALRLDPDNERVKHLLIYASVAKARNEGSL